jgi:formylmethanofuran dehydrogenase subunit E
MDALAEILRASAARHTHLCPRQVLGARMGLYGLTLLGIEAPVARTTALVILETDGCFADGVEIATGATIGHRTLRIQDYGKIAATFVDSRSGRALRLSPVLDARERAWTYTPKERRHYFAQLKAYQAMPLEDLFRVQAVQLNVSISKLISKPGQRVLCDQCGEEIINEREVVRAGTRLCRACAGAGYYLETIA